MLHFSGSYVCYFSMGLAVLLDFMGQTSTSGVNPDHQVAKNVTGGSQPLGSRPAFGPIRTGDGSLAKFFLKDHVARGLIIAALVLIVPK